VHAGGVELDHAVLVGEPAVADRIVLGVELLDLHPLDGRVERVGAAEHQLQGAGDCAKAVGRTDRGGPGDGEPARRWNHRQRGSGDRTTGHTEKRSAGNRVPHDWRLLGRKHGRRTAGI
jgi:hypothetical protein